MKEFWKMGKWAAIILLGAGLLFSGCMGTDSSSSSSSDDDSLPMDAGKNSFLVQVDPEGANIDITPITLGSATTSVPGKLIEMVSVSRGGPRVCDWDGSTLTCDIKIINRDATTIMANVRTVSERCLGPGCANPTINNADYPTPGAQLIMGDSAGLCYTENGQDSNLSGGEANLEGCSGYVVEGQELAVTFLAPGCGEQIETWQYTNNSGIYRYITWFMGLTWYPENPYDGDPRFDFENYSTWVLKWYGVDNLNPAYCGLATATDGWHLGSPWCSSEISPNLTAGNSYWLNMFGEYANRIEQDQYDMWTTWDHNPGGGSAEDYEYYAVAAIEVVFDPTVVVHGGGGTAIDRTGCTTINTKTRKYFCTSTYEYNTKIGSWQSAFTQYSNLPDNRIAVAHYRIEDAFSFYAGGAYAYGMYEDLALGIYTSWCTFAAMEPAKAGQDGIIEVGGFVTTGSLACATVGGVDADLDFWFGKALFSVVGSAGDSAPVMVSQKTNTVFNIYHSNGTANGGTVGGDDVNGGGTAGWCYSPIGADDFSSDCGGVPCCNLDPRAACDPGGTGKNHVVSTSLERTNCQLPPAWGHSRSDCNGDTVGEGTGNGMCGGKQAWNTHVCVQ